MASASEWKARTDIAFGMTNRCSAICIRFPVVWLAVRFADRLSRSGRLANSRTAQIRSKILETLSEIANQNNEFQAEMC